ncbi:MAG: TlpA family protein disulfide reductase [Fimbriimonas sp.]
MRTFRLMAAALAVGSFVLSAVAQDPVEMAQKRSKAPAFKTTTSTGRTVTLAELRKKGPVFLYFIKEHCGANPEAVPLFNAIARAHAGKANLYLVIDTDKASYATWKKSFGTTTPALFDPQKKIIGDYGIDASQCAMMINPDGTVAKFFPGFGLDSLKSLNASLAGASKRPVPAVDLSKAPKDPRFG